MKYTTEDLEKDIATYVAETAQLRKAKGEDYAGKIDTFSDLRLSQLGVRYCTMRILQKCCRILQLLDHPPACKDESIEREFADVFNFAAYNPILYRQESKVSKREVNNLPKCDFCDAPAIGTVNGFNYCHKDGCATKAFGQGGIKVSDRQEKQ